MCEPISAAAATGAASGAGTFATLSTGLKIASVGFNFVNMISNANATSASAAYNRNIAENRAREYDRKAEEAIEHGKVEEENVRRRVRAEKGKQQAQFAARNVLLESGTPAQVLEDTEQFGELDAETVRYNAKNESDYYKRVARNERFMGDADAALTKNKARNQRFEAIGSLATGAGQVAEKWYKYKKPL